MFWGLRGNLLSGTSIAGKVGGESSAYGATNLNRSTLLSYDAAGNVTEDGFNTYTYDAESRIATASGTTYRYDADGQRVQKCSGTSCSETYRYGADGSVLAEGDGSGNLLREFIYYGGDRLARADIPAGNVYYFFHDNVHTTDVLLDANGNLRQEFDYGPFGRQLYTITNQLPDQRYWFDGKERDTETGLDYFGARYYRSNMGRFLSPDWAAHPTAVPYADFGNPQSLNLYSFVRNNPVTNRDPDGHICIFGIGNTCNLPPSPVPRKPFIPPAPFVKANPLFDTPIKAGAAAARRTQAGQKQNGAENASSTFKVGNSYTYTDPVTQGQKKTIDPNNTTGVAESKTVDLGKSPIPLGTEQTGEAHSHPDNVGLSGDHVQRGHDMTIGVYHHPEFEGEYVGLPNGQVQRYDPKTGDITTYEPGEPK